MTTQELKQQIDKVLGNSIRCLLPSYWWKRLFSLTLEKVDEKLDATNIKTINGESIIGEGNLKVGVTTVGSTDELNTLEASVGDIATIGEESTILVSVGDLQQVDDPSEILEKWDNLTRIVKVEFGEPVTEIGYHTTVYLNGKKPYGSDTILITSSEGGFYCGYGSAAGIREITIEEVNERLKNHDYRFIMGINVDVIDSTFKLHAYSASANAYIKGETWTRLLKEGDVTGGGADITIDSELSDTSINAVQNKVITTALNEKASIAYVDEKVANISSEEGLEYRKLYAKGDALGIVTGELTSEQKAYNIETINLYRQNKAIIGYEQVIGEINRISLCKGTDSNGETTNFLFAHVLNASVLISIVISADGSGTYYSDSGLLIDSVVSDSSTNAIQNKAIKAYVDEKVANSGGGSSVDVDTELSNTSTNPVQNKVITETISAIDARVDDIEDFLEQGSNLTLTIKSNQSSDATISAVKASIKYENKTVESGSGIIGLPAFTTITITFPNVEGYKTPEPITFDTNGHPISYTAIYETELVNINLSAWDASSVSGQVITINGKDYTWSDTTISHKVAFGTEYWVYANDKNGYTTKGEKFIASQVSRDVEIVYNAMEGSFITIDQNIADPTTRVSGDIGGKHIQLIRNNSHRYLGKYTADGTMTVCQLDDEDSNYYSDGSSALLDGSQGDVFMKLPKFFYTVHERRPDVYSIGFYYGDNAPSNEWVEWRGDELIGVFKTNENARSAAVRSSYGLSKDDYSERAAARGNGYSLIKWKHNGIIAALYFAFYGNTNSQEVIGIGLEAGNRNCGSTASLGMSDTSASEEAINLWGLENWWGAGYEFFENVIYYDDTCIWKITEDDGTVRERKSTINSGFLGQCYIDFHLDFGIERSDSKASYSATTGYCDGFFHWGSLDSERPVLRGGLSRLERGLLGMYTTYSSSASVTANYFGGSRICFKGTILTNNDSTAFKALTPIN